MDEQEARRMVAVHFRLLFPFMEVGEARLVSEEPLAYLVEFTEEGHTYEVEVKGYAPEDSELKVS